MMRELIGSVWATGSCDYAHRPCRNLGSAKRPTSSQRPFFKRCSGFRAETGITHLRTSVANSRVQGSLATSSPLPVLSLRAEIKGATSKVSEALSLTFCLERRTLRRVAE